MYSRSTWGGDTDPHITTKFSKATVEGDDDPTVSMVIFEWRDEDLVGIWPTEDAPRVRESDTVRSMLLRSLQKIFVCGDPEVSANLCKQEQLGEFILDAETEAKSHNPVITKSIHLKEPEEIIYPVKKTGYYCVLTWAPEGTDYKAKAEFRNAYGELQASQIAKLPFYGALTVVYALLAGYEYSSNQ